MKKYVVLAVIFGVLLAIASACYAAGSDCDLKVAIISDAPVFSYVVGEPYKAEVTVTNLGKDEIKLDKLVVTWQRDDFSAEINPQGAVPESVAAGASAVIAFPITFPDNAVNRKITVSGKLDYTINGKKSSTEMSTSIVLSPQYEITLLPSRSILDPKANTQHIGMSIINHSQVPLEGKITLTTSPGLKTIPDTMNAKIESQGLEAYVFSVNPDKNLAPGHYAVFINVNDKVKDWAAIDVPVLAKKASGKVSVDGKLDDWKGAATVAIAKLVSQNGNKATYQSAGKGEFAYDESNFYMAFEVDGAESITVAFDPLVNGAKTASGGYKDDDYEYSFTGTQDSAVVTRTKAAQSNRLGKPKEVKFALGLNGIMSIYEIAIPWSELAPFKPADGAKFALSVLVNNTDKSVTEWGGGIAGKVDPRRFVPVILTK